MSEFWSEVEFPEERKPVSQSNMCSTELLSSVDAKVFITSAVKDRSPVSQRNPVIQSNMWTVKLL